MTHIIPPGPTYFFTLRLAQPGATTLVDHIGALRFAYARAVQDYPVICHAMIVLPDHLHAVMSEPGGAVVYAERWRQIKNRFAHAVGSPEKLWSRRFLERAIRTQPDFTAALHHCATDADKHGVTAPGTIWPYSSFAKATGQSLVQRPARDQSHLVSAA